MIVFNRELLQEENDRLEQFCNNLDNTSTSFAESFPNYDPNDGIYFIKFFSNAVDWFKNTKVGKAEIKKKIKSLRTALNENIEKNIYARLARTGGARHSPGPLDWRRERDK